ncbi:MAG: glycoside hydrolase [Clostridia bacterium]|nr:glycoside hydrolase [Clostridia bacterium]
MEFDLYPGECWWGGLICHAEKMPFDETTVYRADLLRDRRTQSAPLYLSNKGRYLWSEEPFSIAFDKGHVTVTSEYEVLLCEAGTSLRDAYLAAMKAHFPFADDTYTERDFYRLPQFNTWMELKKNQNQTDILRYAHEVVENGYEPGILLIDGGWQKCQGLWEPNPEMMPDPKGMVDELHAMGFRVMIWVSPFVCPEGQNFLDLYTQYAVEGKYDKPKYNHLLRRSTGDAAIQKWWSGFGAIYNFLLPDDRAHMASQLRHLMEDYGFDGFKFDGGSYMPQSFLTGTDFLGGYKVTDLNIAWIDFAASYPFNEVKDSWKQCGKPVVQRLFDKDHTWVGNGLDCLIPHGTFIGLIGSPFFCPDMVGSGQWTAFMRTACDEELFVRMAECSALFPMMQFSALPWRWLSKEGQRICKKMADLHAAVYPDIERWLIHAEKTGEPIIRSMEYQFPGCGYERLHTQFMLGDDILAAPVVVKGARTKEVFIPEGRWIDQNTGKTYEGKSKITVEAPPDTLPWFRKVK